MEAQDPLADHLHTPIRLQPPTSVGEAVGVPELEGAEVVGEGVEPDVDDLRRIVGHRNAPATGTTGRPRHTDVFESTADEREDLVTIRLRMDLQLTARDQPVEVALVAGQAKEPVRLGDALDRRSVLGAAHDVPGAGDQFAAVVEALAADAVLALVRSPVEVAVGGACPPQPFDRRTVAGIGARA